MSSSCADTVSRIFDGCRVIVGAVDVDAEPSGTADDERETDVDTDAASDVAGMAAIRPGTGNCMGIGMGSGADALVLERDSEAPAPRA